MVVSSQPRRARKSCLPRALRPNGSLCILPLLSFPFDFQLSTFNLRIALSPSLVALCPKSVKQVSSHQSLPHSFLKLPGCVPTILEMEPSSQHLPRSLKFFIFKFLRTLLRFFAPRQKATRFFSSDSALFVKKHPGVGRGLTLRRSNPGKQISLLPVLTVERG